MTEHKYESDMTRQEKRQQEREKIASMNWGQRIDYFFTYYKWVLVVIAFIIMMGAFVRQMYISLQEEEMLNLMIMNAERVDTEKFIEDVRDVLGAEKNLSLIHI